MKKEIAMRLAVEWISKRGPCTPEVAASMVGQACSIAGILGECLENNFKEQEPIEDEKEE